MSLKDFKKIKEDKINMTVSVPKKFKDKFAAVAEKHDMNVAELMRYAMSKVIDEEGK